MKKYCIWVIAILFFTAFLYRFLPKYNGPFWTDEFSSARQASLILDNGLGVITNKDIYFEHIKLVPSVITALSFELSNPSEANARLPFILLGSLIPAALFLLGKRFFNYHVGLSAGLLSLFSYFFITWSQQARGYALLQLLIISLFIAFDLWQKNKSIKLFIILLINIIIGLLTHPLFFLSLVAISLVFSFKTYKQKVSFSTFTWAAGILLILTAVIAQEQILYLLNNGMSNNLSYYHSFLWREHNLITFAGFFGLVMMLAKKKHRQHGFLLLTHTVLHLLFLSFFFEPKVTRYLLPIFTWLYLGTAYFIFEFFKLLAKSNKVKSDFIPGILSLVTVLFIVANGNNFTLFPKKFYSVNHDFREIALIDYDDLYSYISDLESSTINPVAIIETWPDRLFWYKGNDFEQGFVFRWSNAEVMKATNTIDNPSGLPREVSSNLEFVSSAEDLELVVSRYSHGFIWIDDSTLPADVIAHAENNFKKELYLDHYPLDDNPFSIWPGTLYSWGFQK